MTPQVGKWYLTRNGHHVKVIGRDSWGYLGSNDEAYCEHGNVYQWRENPRDLDMERGPIEPTAEELALYALQCLWESHDNAGGSAFQWTSAEVSAVKEALVKAGRIVP